jgi:hypothetical protein
MSGDRNYQLGIDQNSASESTLALLTTKYATRIVEAAPYTYVGRAAIGSAVGSAVWQVYRIDETSGTIILWADSNSNFDNKFEDYLTLTYG